MRPTDARLAARLADVAGDLLLQLRASSGLSGKDLGRAGDLESNELLLQELAAAVPDDAVLSEESADSPARLDADRVWIIDPLDGTREYGMVAEDRTDWAVHVALWERSAGLSGRGAITAAAVSQPALSAIYSTDGVAATLGRVAAGSDRPARLLVSDSRPPAWATPVAERFGAELVPMGSAGAKAMAVVRGEYDGYLHDGGQWEWDSAAPVGVALAAGLHASRIDGSELLYNSAHPYLPDLLICRAEFADVLLAAIADATA
ncbi:MAG TPA: 3'(2'),5'-bisphosphate nucleotidase CysQ [Jatrophihabitans sp.]|jgi:3'(2'), 5'-bisphosphate nucleotidase